MLMIKLFKKQELAVKIVIIAGFFLMAAGVAASFIECSDNKSCFASVSDSLLKRTEQKAKPEVLPKVQMVNVGEFQANNFAVSATGQVETADQVNLISQVSEKVKNINVSIGQKVKAGQVLAVLENETALAQLMQAEAGLEAAEALLAEMERGARSEQMKIVQTQLENARLSFEQAEDNLENTKNKAEADMQRIYSSALNSLVLAGDSAKNALLFATELQYEYFEDSSLQSVEILEIKERIMELLFDEKDAGRWARRAVSNASGGLFFRIKNISLPGEIEQSLEEMELVLTKVRELILEVPIYQISEQDNAFLATEKSIINNQITSITSTKQGIAVQEAGNNSLIGSANIAFTQAKAGLENAQNQLDLILAGATAEQISVQKAAVKSAKAGVLQARAFYNKTIIVSPISGKIASLPVKKAELVNPGQLIASVVNDSGLKIAAYIDSSNLKKISPGNSVIIDKKIKGTVVNVSPAIDPIRKKVEVEIAVEGNNLIVGQFVNLKISVSEQALAENVYLLPLSSVRITSDKPLVFLVENQVIVEKEIVLGNVIGDSIEVLDGLDSKDNIVSSVRGLAPGQKVEYD